MKRDVKDKLIFLVFLSVVFLILTLFTYYSGFDEKTEDYFSSLDNGIIYSFMSYFTLFGGMEGVFLISLICLTWFLLKKRYDYALFYVISVVGAVIAKYALKEIFQRERPEIYGIEFAFPSGHAMISLVAFGAVSLLLWPRNKKLAIGLLVFPLLIGFSRIYLDVHWLSDVLGGFFFGTLLIMITFYLFYGWKK